MDARISALCAIKQVSPSTQAVHQILGASRVEAKRIVPSEYLEGKVNGFCIECAIASIAPLEYHVSKSPAFYVKWSDGFHVRWIA